MFEDDGYEVFPGVIPLDVMQSLLDAVRAGVERFRDGDVALTTTGVSLADYMRSKPDRNPGVDPDTVTSEPYMLGNLTRLDKRFGKCLGDESFWTLAADLLGAPLETVVYHYSSVVRKPALVGPSLSYHRDYGNNYICTALPQFVRLLVPLQQMSGETGGTGVIARSHLIEDVEALERVGAPESSDAAFYPTLNPGDVLAIHAKTLHGGGTNRSSIDRDLLTIQFGVLDAPMLCTSTDEHLTLLGRAAFLAESASG
jgi:hypothetical protein